MVIITTRINIIYFMSKSKPDKNTKKEGKPEKVAKDPVKVKVEKP